MLLFWLFSVQVVHGIHLNGHPVLMHAEEVLNFLMVGFKEGPNEIQHGHKQPHADDLHISFSAFDKEWNFELFVDHGMFSETSRFEFHDDDGMHTVMKPHHTIYQTKEGAWPSATFNIHDSGTVHAQIITDEGRYTIDPADTFPEFDLKAAMGMFHDSHIVVKELHSQDASRSLLSNELKIEQLLPPYISTTSSEEEGGQKSPKSWTDCNHGLSSKLAMGFAVTHDYYKLTGSNKAGIELHLKNLLADSNTIYTPQMGVHLYIEKAHIRTTSSTKDALWNQQQANSEKMSNGGCGVTASDNLEQFREWRLKSHPKDAGLWHLLTTCFPPPGTVGLAYLNGLCSSQMGSGLSSSTNLKSSGTRFIWKIVAHEIGHNFGGGHSFEQGQGTTGGIMDYGDGKLGGIYQFNSQFRKKQICERIKSSRAQLFSSGKCWGNYVGKKGKKYEWVASDTAVCTEPCGKQPVKSIPFVCRECTYNTGTCHPTGTIASAKGQCISPQPQPKIEKTNVGCPTKQCICGNGVVESNEGCDPGKGVDPCCKNCNVVESDFCKSKTGGMDACFVSVKNSKTYCFKGYKYIRYTPTAQGSLKADATYPRAISKNWPGLSFIEDIDAVIQKPEGSIYFIKGLQYSVYEFGYGAHADGPQNATAFFGLPAGWTKVDAAISLINGQGGAYLFNGLSYCKFAFGENRKCSTSVRPITDFSGTKPFPMGGVSAARRYWPGIMRELDGVVDLLWQNKFVQFEFGVGMVMAKPTALPDSAIREPIFHRSDEHRCKLGCLQCSSRLCDKCGPDYVLVSGVCYPKQYVLQMSFDDGSKAADQRYVQSRNVVSWNYKIGVTGKAVELAPTGFIYLNPNKIPNNMKDFEFHFWVNIKVGTTGNINLCALHITKSVKTLLVSFRLKSEQVGTWVPTVKILHSVSGSMKEFTLTATYSIEHSKWKHLVVTFQNGNVKLSTDGSAISLPYDDALTKGYNPNAAWKFQSFHIGKSNINALNGINGYMDQFHIDRLAAAPAADNVYSAAANMGTLSMLAFTFLCFVSYLAQFV